MAYEYASKYSGLDFAHVLHQFNSPKHPLGPETWKELIDIRKRYSSDRFVTCAGIEFYVTGGHRTLLFKTLKDEQKFVEEYAWPRCLAVKDASELFRRLDAGGSDAFTCIHHPRFLMPGDYSQPQHPRDRLAEVYSRWGLSELPGPHSILHALQRGYRYGLIGGTDNHLSQPGNGPFGVNEGASIAGVFSRKFSWEAIYEALYNRHCYATTGTPILVYFSLDNMLMGSELDHYQGIREFVIRIAGTFELGKIELIRNGEPIVTFKPQTLVFDKIVMDSEPLENIVLEPTFKGMKPFCFYYTRVTQNDGEMAWSSPIWLTE
jgi:hypothetical protein